MYLSNGGASLKFLQHSHKDSNLSGALLILQRLLKNCKCFFNSLFCLEQSDVNKFITHQKKQRGSNWSFKHQMYINIQKPSKTSATNKNLFDEPHGLVRRHDLAILSGNGFHRNLTFSCSSASSALLLLAWTSNWADLWAKKSLSNILCRNLKKQ